MRAPAQGHEHGVDLPVLVVPLLVETLLTLGFVTAGVAVALRPFLGGRDDVLVAKAATLGAAAAGIGLLLTEGPADGMPTGPLAALAIAGIVVPFCAVRGQSSRLRSAAVRLRPLVVLGCLLLAVTSTGAGAAFAAVVAAGWISPTPGPGTEVTDSSPEGAKHTRAACRTQC